MAASQITVTWRIKSDRTESWMQAAEDFINQQVHTTADNVAQWADFLVPVDTGALQASIYINDGTESDYAESVGLAARLNPDINDFANEVDPEFVIYTAGTPGQQGAVCVIGAAAPYGIYVEEGTHAMAPQPFMRPAAESNSDEFAQDLRNGLSRLI